MRKNIEEFFKSNFQDLPKKILVAVSGGVDSMALLFLLKDFSNEFGVEIFAVTVDHKMRENSGEEAFKIQQILRQNNINHEILEIDKAKLPKKNIEAKLRQERYSLLYDFAIKNEINSVFVGHHKNDLAENFLIRIFRGSQLDGLSTMNEVFEFKKVRIYRPLLSFSKNELISFLKEKKIQWFEDETNQDEKFLRNKIRKFFDSFEEKDLIVERISKAGEVIKESKNFEDEVLLEKAREILVFVKNGGFLLDFEKYKFLRLGANCKNDDIKNSYLESNIKVPDFINNDMASKEFRDQLKVKSVNICNKQKPTYSNIALKILSLILTEISGQIYKPRLEKLEKFEIDLLSLEKGKKRDLYGCFANNLTKSNIAKIIDFIDEKDRKKIKSEPERYILIYFASNNKSKIEKFDEEINIENGRFLIDKNGKRTFYFRTILKKIFVK